MEGELRLFKRFEGIGLFRGGPIRFEIELLREKTKVLEFLGTKVGGMVGKKK